MHLKSVICHYWYFLSKDFMCEPYVCNCCPDLIQKAINFNDVAIVCLKVIHFWYGDKDDAIHFWYGDKDDAINIINNSDLNDKNGLL